MEYKELWCLKVQNLRESLSMKEPNQTPSCPHHLSQVVLQVNESFLKPVISILRLLPTMNLYYTIKYTNFQKTASSKRQITLSHNHILSQTSLGETWILLIKVLNSSYCCCVKHTGIFQTLTYSLQEMSRSNLNFHLW